MRGNIEVYEHTTPEPNYLTQNSSAAMTKLSHTAVHCKVLHIGLNNNDDKAMWRIVFHPASVVPIARMVE